MQDGFNICCNGVSTFEFGYQVRNFWPHLQASGFKIKGITNQLAMTNAVATGIKISGTDQNVPKFALGGNTGVIIANLKTDRSAGTSGFGYAGTTNLGETLNKGNFYWLADFTATTNHQILSGNRWDESIPVTQALALDTKLDDGSPNTGDVIDRSYWSSGCLANNTSSTYTPANEDGFCSLAVRMMD